MRIIDKIIDKYRAEGLQGVGKAVVRKVFNSIPAIHPVKVALEELSSRNGFCVVQLGAFTGKTFNDPIYEILSARLQEVQGTLLVVEPVKCFFEQLVANYAGIPGVVFENVAIAEHNGTAQFFRLGIDPMAHGYPGWLCELSSLKAERMGVLWDRYEANQDYKAFYLKHRIEETVRCITFEELMKRHALSKIDLLQMDVEGYELEILKTIDFRHFPARFVNYENVLLQESKKEAERLMRKVGYRLVDFGQDTFCYHKEDRHLRRRWLSAGDSST